MAAFAPAVGQGLRSRPPRNPNSQKNDSPRQLEFTQAMKDFKNMFPDMDDEVIEAVLRANNGLVDATIDQLLTMGAGSEPKDDFPHLPSYADTGHAEPPPAYSPREDDSTDSRPLPARPYSAWNPPLLGALPDDFLRFTCHPSSNARPANVSASPSTADRNDDKRYEQFLEDAKLAQVLQNEEFVRELTRNKDFMMSLERDTLKKKDPTLNNANTNTSETQPVVNTSSLKPVDSSPAVVNSTPSSVSSAPPAVSSTTGDEDLLNLGAVGGSTAPPHEDPVFREKLKHMGKSTRKKFDKMARIFHRKKNTQRANLMAGGSTSTANLLEEYEDDDDDELLNHIASGRLEIVNEADNTISKDSSQSDNHPQSRVFDPFDPVEFYAEDNEFHYKDEK